MKKRIIFIIITISIISSLFITNTLGHVNKAKNELNIKEENDVEAQWYFLPSYENYAPSGLPDFDQRQQKDWNYLDKIPYSFCGPASLANVLWWFDSKNSEQAGFPGDGNDTYSLVRKYHSNDLPGFFADDHDFNNVNDVNTPWIQKKNNIELIEKIAWYSNINWFKTPFISRAGMIPLQMKFGLKRILLDSHLFFNYKIRIYHRPSFSLIYDSIKNNKGVVLQLALYVPGLNEKGYGFGHYVSVAGVNRYGGIALSDPYYDIDNPLEKKEDYTNHNNASNVSHDKYYISYDSPFQIFSDWWLPDYPMDEGALIFSAIIISQNNFRFFRR